jgi:hypothetical protein
MPLRVEILNEIRSAGSFGSAAILFKTLVF